MPWSNQGGGWQGGGNRGPWSQGPSSGGGSGGHQPPDLEELLKRGQDRFRRALPGKLNGGGVGVIALILAIVWLATGFYQVRAGEKGVETRFGKFTKETQQGFNFHWPYPIESVTKVSVDRINTILVGYAEAGAAGRGEAYLDVPKESLMLTGDENIVDVNFAVQWNVKNAADYLFNVREPSETIKAVAESAMREVVGRNLTRDPNAPPGQSSASLIEQLQTEKRTQTQNEVQRLIQEALDSYRAGVQVKAVLLQKVDPPREVIDAFRDVQAARANKDQASNDARRYANKVIPEARGEAQQIRKDSEAYREQVVNQATGEAKRFLAIYEEYRNAKDVTQRRMFLETMEKVLARSPKIVLDTGGAYPLLPLGDALRRGLTPPTAQGNKP